MDLQLPRKPRPRGARKFGAGHRDSKNARPPVAHGYIKSFDGTKLFYSTEGKGKPLVFCYGLVCSSLHWTYQIDRFQNDYQAVWFDYRGHQNSEIPKDPKSLTIENIARDLGMVLDELGIEDAVLLGHSMGVNVVLEFYRQQPKRVAGLVLANGTAKRPLETLFSHNAFQAGFKLLRMAHDRSPELVRALWKLQKGNPLSRTLVALGGFNPHLTPSADIEAYVDQVAEMDPSILVHLIENYDKYDATAWLHSVNVPTMVIAGDQDMIIPIEQQELLRQLIPNSQLEVIRHGSHCPQMDLPDLVNVKIEKFLDRIGYSAVRENPVSPGEAPVDPLRNVEPLLEKNAPESLKTELPVAAPLTDVRDGENRLG
jgi:pimeloyl-ACP methyl ester carboxylesterase